MKRERLAAERPIIIIRFICLCFAWSHLKKLKLLSIFYPIEKKKTYNWNDP